MVTAMERDLDGFGAFLRARVATEEAVAGELELRKRGAASASIDEAARAAARWAAEGSGP
jgi:hypothetical protein